MFINHSDALIYNPPMLGYGIAVLDIEGNGQFAFFVAGFGCPNRVLIWDGDRERLADRFDATLAAPARQAIGVAAGDIDGDGREEIYVLNTDTFGGAKRFGDHLFAFREGQWADLFTTSQNQSVVNRIAGRSVCATDRWGAGRYGFVIANYGGPIRLYETKGSESSEGNDELQDSAATAGIARVTGGRSLVSLPLVSAPGTMDIFAANENGPNFLFVSNGDGTYTDRAEELGVADPYENGRGIAVLDADANGRFDLCIGNWEGEQRLYLQSPVGGFLDTASSDLARPLTVRTVIAADFDNDGMEELFFNAIGQPNRLFAYRDGAWRRVPLGDAEEAQDLGTGAAVADIDGDGRLELLIAHGESGAQPLSFYKPVATENAYLRVQPLTASGAPARGAVVTLQTRSRIQRRAIDAGSGYLCQMEPVAHFGLGRETAVESVHIVWPGGASTTIEHPAVRQTLRLFPPSGPSGASLTGE